MINEKELSLITSGIKKILCKKGVYGKDDDKLNREEQEAINNHLESIMKSGFIINGLNSSLDK